MLKKLLIILFLLLSFQKTYPKKSGQERIDSLLTVLKSADTDSAKFYEMYRLVGEYIYFKGDEAIKYEKPLLELATHFTFKKKEAVARQLIGRIYWKRGDFSKALEYHLQAKKMFNEMNLPAASCEVS